MSKSLSLKDCPLAIYDFELGFTVCDETQQFCDYKNCSRRLDYLRRKGKKVK